MCDETSASLEIYERLEPIIPLLEKMMEINYNMKPKKYAKTVCS